jgi:hydroxypyruvate isomerase
LFKRGPTVHQPGRKNKAATQNSYKTGISASAPPAEHPDVVYLHVLRFAANLSLQFGEVGLLERFASARAAGFAGVELPFPYAHPKEQLAELLHQHGLELVVQNLPAGSWERGDRGIACLPERRAEFRDGVALALEYAVALGCRRVNCLAGVGRGVTIGVAFDTLVENTRFAASALAKAGIELLLEPINTRDVPHFFLNRSAQALEVIEAAGNTNVRILYDVYHMQIMQGYLVEDIRRCFGRIGHVHIADNPGRHQPGTGDIDYAVVFRHLEQLGYTGWIGCEYQPLGPSQDVLSWLRAYHRAARA